MSKQSHPALDVLDVAILDDLSASGLSAEDIGARPARGPERASVGASSNAQGYVIPYYSLEGEEQDFYRVKILSGDDPGVKYRQVGGSANQLYFPPRFNELRRALKQVPEDNLHRKVLILTEGEKKAARALKAGFQTVAVTGVDSWRTRNLIFPKDTKVKTVYGKRGGLQLRLPQGSQVSESWMLAKGLNDLIMHILAEDLTLVLCYDSDVKGGVKYEVQQSAAILGYCLRAAGVPSYRIKQLVLPSEGEKVGLDDFLEAEGNDVFEGLVEECYEDPHAFPTHPNPKGYIAQRLNRGNLKRADAVEIGFSILTELDAKGVRMYEESSREPYYFNNHTLQLMPMDLMRKHGAPMHETRFGQALYRDFGLTASDSRLLSQLASQLTGEHPTYPVDPRHVMATQDEGIALQISDSEFVKVTADPMMPFKLCNNGTESILFEQDNVEAADGEAIISAAHQEMRACGKGPLHPKWLDVIEDTNIKSETDRQIAALLFYISPWLLRWRGLQLPVEVFIGPPGSGKSSLAALRLQIMTGRPTLRNLPNDIRDWNATIGRSGGIHVVDNVHFTNRDLKQKLSDEICRIITEPDPHVEMRQLYTTAGVYRMPVRCTFALTALQAPFTNSDFLQRAVLFELQRPDDATPDSEWLDKQLKRFGGREQWIAHHLVFLHKFLRGCKKGNLWNPGKKVKHRLVHFELTMSIAAKILGIKDNKLGLHLSKLGEGKATQTDWALEGLKAFVQEGISRDKVGKKHEFSSKDIAEWSQMNEDFEECEILINSRRVGRYMLTNSSTISRLLGIKDAGKKNNRQTYYISEKAGELIKDE